MKKIIEEIRYGNTGRYFRINTREDNGKLISIENIRFYIKETKIENYTFLILYDENMEVVKDVYNFINHKCKYKTYGTRNIYINILKQFYEFSKIINKPINQFEITDFHKFQTFLYGNAKLDINSNMYLYSNKSGNTVLKFLTVVKDFLKYCRYNNYKLVSKIAAASSKSISKKNSNCPKYTSQEEMISILDYLENDETLDDETKLKYECIYRLMYEAGLRIGEVLGLTLEDFELKTRKTDGETIGLVVIRNRISDNKKQNAKTCLHILNKESYNTSEYKTFGIGFQTIAITEALYNDIMDYFDSFCTKISDDDLEPAKADAVTKEDNNYYIFNNKNKNTPLNRKILEAYTRKMFKELNIAIDNDKRSINLFHRFRHGFIMNLLYVQKLSPTEAIKYSRHTSARSLEPYNNPTSDEIIKHLETVEEFYTTLERNANNDNKEKNEK